MISIKECLDYSDLTEDEVAVIAEHEHLPFAYAAQLACGLAATDEGSEVIRCLLKNALCDAQACGHLQALKVAQMAVAQFEANHQKS